MSTKNENNLKVLSENTCPSLSGKSTLSYTVSTDGEEVYLLLTGNSNPGQFNVNAPVSLTEIMKLLEKVSSSTNISSVHMSSLFRGASANNAGFILAVLMDLGLIVLVDPVKPRSRRLSPDYEVKIGALGNPKTNRSVRKKVAKKKATAKRRKS